MIFTIILILVLVLLMQYSILVTEIAWKETTKKKLASDSIPIVGLYLKIKRQIDSLPEE